MTMRPAVSPLLIAALAVSCSAPEPPLMAGCNPLGGGEGEDCLLPFPSSYFTRTDAQTATGRRVSMPADILPAPRSGKPIDPTQLNHLDGFSPATTMLAYFPAPLDGSSLPGPARIAASLQQDSPIQVLRYDTGDRVPLFAELDANASLQDHARQALSIRPVVRLAAATRYVVAIRGLRQAGGAALPPLSGFQALRDGQVGDSSPRAGERARFAEIFAALERAGIVRSSLQLAWDFTTASDAAISGRMVHMIDAARAYLPGPAPAPVTVEQVREDPVDQQDLVREVLGTFTAPSFLVEDTTGGLNFGPDGEPVLRGYGQFPLVIHIPRCAATATLPLPVMVFGHGSYATAQSEMALPYQREIINRLCMVQIGTNWVGRARPDWVPLLNSITTDLNGFVTSTERLQQAHVNVNTLARLIKQGRLNQLEAMQLDGKPVVDGKLVYYYGTSEGGYQGATALALSPDIERGALNVPWGIWSLYFWRSSDFHDVVPFLDNVYPDALNRQVLIALTQPLNDYTDPINYAAHLLHDPLPGNTVKPILYQEGISDGSVPNQATRAMVRTMGLPLLGPGVEAVFGVTAATAPQPAAYVQFDVGQMPRLGGNDVPPPRNLVHEAIRRLEAAKQQLQSFLREGGQVEDTCQGNPCVFPVPPDTPLE